jgi:hypothetical protein
MQVRVPASDNYTSANQNQIFFLDSFFQDIASEISVCLDVGVKNIEMYNSLFAHAKSPLRQPNG